MIGSFDLGAGLPEKPGQKAGGRGVPCTPVSRIHSSSKAKMRDTPSAPTAAQGLLRYFHPSWAGRSRAASAEKHLCARGMALWTCIRSLTCKGKVGRRVCQGLQGGPRGAGSCSVPPPALHSVPLLVWYRVWFSRGEGPGDYCSLEGKGRVASVETASVSPFLKTPRVVQLSLSLGTGGTAPAPSFLDSQDSGVTGQHCMPFTSFPHTWSS